MIYMLWIYIKLDIFQTALKLGNWHVLSRLLQSDYTTLLPVERLSVW